MLIALFLLFGLQAMAAGTKRCITSSKEVYEPAAFVQIQFFVGPAKQINIILLMLNF